MIQSPKSLGKQKKENQRIKLMQKGKELLLTYGIGKVSVDDVARAAGIAKGSFYLHFTSKEAFLFALIKDLHEQYFGLLEQMININNTDNLREHVRRFIKELFRLPEFLFFLKNYKEIEELFDDALQEQAQSLKDMEYSTYDEFLKLAGADINRVKTGVVLNYIHTVFTGIFKNDIIFEQDIPETYDVLIDGLITYIFGN